MKQLEELEESFLYEIKPFIDKFVELRKQELDLDTRMKCVGIRKLVQRKTDEFREEYTKTMNAKINEIYDKRDDILATGENLEKLRDTILEIRELKGVFKAKGDKEKYEVLTFTEMEKKSEFDKMFQQYKEKSELFNSSDKNTFNELKKKQKDFQEKYGDMDKITENELYTLDVFIGNKEKENQIIVEDRGLTDEEGNEVKDIEGAQQLQVRVDEQIEEELKRIEQEKIQTVLDQNKQEFEEYIDLKMKELEENIDKELEEMEKEKAKEDLVQEDVVKKTKNSVWQRIKSFFRIKILPALIEPITQEEDTDLDNQSTPKEAESKDDFKERIANNSPSQQQQAKNTKGFIRRHIQKKSERKEEKEIKEVLAMLDK